MIQIPLQISVKEHKRALDSLDSYQDVSSALVEEITTAKGNHKSYLESALRLVEIVAALSLTQDDEEQGELLMEAFTILA